MAAGSGGLGISENLKFTRVTILDPSECAENIPADLFLNNIVENEEKDADGEWPIICATGVRLNTYGDGYSNTCGGDSGMKQYLVSFALDRSFRWWIVLF